MIIIFHVQQLFFVLFILTVNCVFVIYYNFSNIAINFYIGCIGIEEDGPVVEFLPEQNDGIGNRFIYLIHGLYLPLFDHATLMILRNSTKRLPGSLVYEDPFPGQVASPLIF